MIARCHRMTGMVAACVGMAVAVSGVRAAEPDVWEMLDISAHGFLDARTGARTQDDPNEDDRSLAETRFQLELYRMGRYVTWQVRSDFIYDDLSLSRATDLEDGTGGVDLREAYLLASPVLWADIKLGRQILTWGTGDLLFINDMFPKDWQAFFIGRDEDYLKAPSDALFVSLFPAFANIDVAYMPRFDSDRYISGERISYWNPALGSRAGRNAVVEADKPDEWFQDDEVSVRVYRSIGSAEVAAYGYSGFWKSPVGVDAASGIPTFPKLAVAGLSFRRPLGQALVNAEAGYYDSREDRSGEDPLTPNSEWRGLLGYERELARNLTLGMQYYLEHMQDYDAYLGSITDPATARDEDRHVITVRLTQRLLNQNLTATLFAYYSPSDQDAYLRPKVEYKASDRWILTAGANVFLGEEAHTFFGQFEDNSNVYGSVRYSF